MNKSPGGTTTRGGGNTKSPAARSGGSPAQRQASAMRTQDFVRGVVLELRRVTWPTREEWISATILTVALVVAIGLYTYVVDWVFNLIFSQVHPQ